MKIFPYTLSIYIIFFNIIRNILCISRDLHYLEEKCVLNDFYLKSNIIITFNVTEGNFKKHEFNEPSFIINVYNKDNNNLIKQFNTQKTYGKFSFNVDKTGHYKTCIIGKDSFIFGEKRIIIFDFNIESSLDVKENSKKTANMKDFEIVNHKMQMINDKVEQIENMQAFSNSIENTFSKNQINTSKRIIQISIIQILIIFLVGIYHIYALKKMFNEKANMPF